MTDENARTPSPEKDEQDQVFGRKAEERKEEVESEGGHGKTDDARPAEPHAGGKA